MNYLLVLDKHRHNTSVLHSHWSRFNEALIGRELRSVATPAIICHKEPALASKDQMVLWNSKRPKGSFCLHYAAAGSLWHNDSWLPCTGRSVIKNQRRASKKDLPVFFLCSKAPNRGFGCPSWFFMAQDCWRSNSCLLSPRHGVENTVETRTNNQHTLT